ncbi:MAG: Nif11-like leader peptide family RiPP precursor [Thermoanaerobaculia bacterium]
MSQGNFEAFLADLQQNTKLREELEALDPNPEAWIRWANSKGYSLTREDVARLAESRDLDISDDDLEKVAGGWCGNELTTG